MNYNLERFITAQDSCFADVIVELKVGWKKTHWMWFVFPQLEGLGRSSTARFYGISGQEEAVAYLENDILRERLVECAEILLAVNHRSLFEIFGNPDQIKFCSSMTLFEAVRPDMATFSDCLAKYCDGKRDLETLRLLNIQE